MNLTLEDPISCFKLIKNKFIIIGFGNQISVYEIINHSERIEPKYLQVHEYEVSILEYFENNSEIFIVTGSMDCHLKIWNFSKDFELFSDSIQSGVITCISISDSNLVVGLNNGCLMVYDFQGKEISKLSQKQEVTCVQMNDSSFLVQKIKKFQSGKILNFNVN
jgi:WD40 repeat protein